MLKPAEFYKGFQVNFFDYKQLQLADLLENYDNKEFPYSQNIIGYDRDDHLRSIKIDIRQTYFQAIETLFELIVSLKPNERGKFDDQNILINLAQRKDHYEEIRNFGQDKGGFSFFNQIFTETSGREITALQYIFYLTLPETDYPLIPSSIEAIKHALKIFASDISDRREYNSMKHGLRLYRALNSFMLFKKEDQNPFVKWDLNDSMTFYDQKNKTGEIEFITKVFDPKRDIAMTILCSNLISNIISLRRKLFFNDQQKVAVFFWGKDEVNQCNKMNVEVRHLNFKTTIIGKKRQL